jgi:hypothetical protein
MVVAWLARIQNPAYTADIRSLSLYVQYPDQFTCAMLWAKESTTFSVQNWQAALAGSLDLLHLPLAAALVG